MCEMIFTSDNGFFDSIGEQETQTLLDTEKQIEKEEREKECEYEI